MQLRGKGWSPRCGVEGSRSLLKLPAGPGGPQCIRTLVVALVAKSSATLCDPMTAAHQAPLSMGFPRPEYWSGLPFPSPGDLSNQEWNPHLLHWQVDALPLIHQGSPASILTLKKKKDLWKTLNHISLCHPTWTTPWQYMNSSLTRKFIVKAAKIPLKLRE